MYAKEIILFLATPILIVPMAECFFSKRKLLYAEDQFFTLRNRYNPYSNEILQFMYFMIKLPEYRSVFYHRRGLAGRMYSLFLPGQKCLYISTPRQKKLQ